MVKDKSKRIMVDMSATLIHHGHIRLLKAAKELGDVVVALTTDDEIRKIFNLSKDVNKSKDATDKNGFNFFNIQKHIAKCYHNEKNKNGNTGSVNKMAAKNM